MSGKKENGMDKTKTSTVLLLNGMASAKLRTIAFLSKHKATAERDHKQKTKNDKSYSSDFHSYKDSSITQSGCKCLNLIFQPDFFYVISAAKYFHNEMVVSLRAVLAFYEAHDDEARKIFNLLEAISS